MNHSIDILTTDVVKYAKQMADSGLTPNTQGNLSLRDPDTGLVAVTPHDYAYDIMTPEDVVIIDLDGDVVEGQHPPSEETPVHRAVYRERPWVNGIVHSEPIYVNCFGALGWPIAPVVVSLLVDVGGEVPVMPFQPSGSLAFGHRMLEVMGDRQAVIWANHGLLTIGETLEEAFRCTVTVETAARIYHLALQLDQPNLVSLESLKSANG